MVRRGLILKATVAVAALVCALGIGVAHAQTPTTTPTSAEASTSLVTIRFVHDGQPVSVELAQSLGSLTADGVGCLVLILPLVADYPGYGTSWPLQPMEGQPEECTQGPPTTLRFEFLSEFGPLSVEFVWTGGDMTVDLEVPAAATATATSPTPIATVLPQTGLRLDEHEDGGSNRLLPAALAGIAALAALAGAVALKRR
ncbi:MAG: hypothetical protein WEE64_16035 [Dehalococcoidia bacterium]